MFLLWFAFIMYLWNIENNEITWNHKSNYVVICFHLVSLKYWKQQHLLHRTSTTVVICFHLVSLKYWKQQGTRKEARSGSCDLLSSCIFEILKTTRRGRSINNYLLWFAFILYLWNIENNINHGEDFDQSVVICFHLVSLKYWKQHNCILKVAVTSCDLLSSCIFEILKTTCILDTAFA